jgi:hypothetical protein
MTRNASAGLDDEKQTGQRGDKPDAEGIIELYRMLAGRDPSREMKERIQSRLQESMRNIGNRGKEK